MYVPILNFTAQFIPQVHASFIFVTVSEGASDVKDFDPEETKSAQRSASRSQYYINQNYERVGLQN